MTGGLQPWHPVIRLWQGEPQSPVARRVQGALRRSGVHMISEVQFLAALGELVPRLQQLSHGYGFGPAMEGELTRVLRNHGLLGRDPQPVPETGLFRDLTGEDLLEASVYVLDWSAPLGLITVSRLHFGDIYSVGDLAGMSAQDLQRAIPYFAEAHVAEVRRALVPKDLHLADETGQMKSRDSGGGQT